MTLFCSSSSWTSSTVNHAVLFSLKFFIHVCRPSHSLFRQFSSAIVRRVFACLSLSRLSVRFHTLDACVFIVQFNFSLSCRCFHLFVCISSSNGRPRISFGTHTHTVYRKCSALCDSKCCVCVCVCCFTVYGALLVSQNVAAITTLI